MSVFHIFFQSVTNLPATTDNESQFFTIHLPEKLQAGIKCSVFMEFQGTMKNDLNGLYWSSYKEEEQTR